MTEQLREIGGRLSALRNIAEMTPEMFCGKIGVTAQELAAYEKGEKDFSFSFLFNAANVLGVDIVDLMSGDSPKLSTCCLVRKGGGYAVDRNDAYSYKHLAFTFRNKGAEPFMVTVAPSPDGVPPEKHTHEGQELEYMVSGRTRFYLGDATYDLEPGDSVYFDTGIPHAISALDGKSATFLAVVVGKKEGS